MEKMQSRRGVFKRLKNTLKYRAKMVIKGFRVLLFPGLPKKLCPPFVERLLFFFICVLSILPFPLSYYENYLYLKIKRWANRNFFTFQGREYNYFVHKYNNTWRNERSVEVPIVYRIVQEFRGKNILEVGNVLSHYYPVNHDIVDKYEVAPGVMNIDVVDYKPAKKYDLIVSISTLEHVGWDERPREPLKVLRAVDNLRNLLIAGGELVVTLPIGQNPVLDKLIADNKIKFDKIYCMRRTGFNKWVETSYEEIKGHYFYGMPFPNANAIIIGIIEKKE